MKNQAICALIVLMVSALSAGSPVPCRIAPIDSGYGADGQYAVSVDSIRESGPQKRMLYAFHPIHPAGKSPVVFFLPGQNVESPSAYNILLRHIASRGNTVMYVPFRERKIKNEQLEEYRNLLSAVNDAAKAFTSNLDTSRIGFVGHSFGAGAIPFLAWKIIVDRGWGSQGAFLYIMAPWYVFDMEPEQFEQFPSKVNIIVEVFEDDLVNDHRIAVDLFNAMNIPDSQKIFTMVRTDTGSGCLFAANNFVPASRDDIQSPLAAYGVYRLIDALADYSFFGNKNARAISLGDGTPAQKFMGTWPDGRAVTALFVTRSPSTKRTQQSFVNFWDKPINPRKNVSLSFVSEIGKRRFYFVKQSMKHYWKTAKARIGVKLKARNDLIADVCTIRPIQAGYGANGPYAVLMDSIPLAAWPGHFVHIFLPDSAPGKRPVILFSHGYTAGKPEFYLPLLNHIVSKGFIVFFSTFDMFQIDRYESRKYTYLLTGFESACNLYRNSIDTARVGFIGHSFGAGATPYVAAEYISRKHWGSAGSFMHILAPWYTFEMSDEDLLYFPGSSAIMAMQVFHDDKVNDHRMAINLFKAINIPDSSKNYLLMYSDSNSVCKLIAHHRVPGGLGLSDEEENSLDYYGIWRIFDALAAAAFEKDSTARKLAMGHDAETTYMGVWPDGRLVIPMLSTLSPTPDRPENFYVFPWSSARNPRRNSTLGFAR